MKLFAITPLGEFEIEKIKPFSTNGCLVRMKKYPHTSSDSMTAIQFDKLRDEHGNILNTPNQTIHDFIER